ncbi:MAG: response regulator [Caulobacteraceae bacterium]|nr:response regulator [Caulobacteraceae bacterium]
MAVEDERIVALHLKQQLTKLGFDVAAVAASGEIALRDIVDHHPDLVLMDIHIEGDMDGIETAARILADLGIPVIYLTAYSEEATFERARATKPYGYLIKPYSERELYATIQMALERRNVEMALRASEERFRSIFAAISEGVFVIDMPTGIFTEVNEAGCAIFGYAPGDLVGCDIGLILAGEAPYARDEAVAQIEQAPASGAPHQFAWRCRTKDGQRFWAEVSLRSASIGGRRVALSIVRRLASSGGGSPPAGSRSP